MENLKKSLYALFLVNLGIALALDLISPLQPLFIQSLGASVVEVGFVLSVSSFTATALIIPSSLMAEKYGNRKIIILSVISASISVLLYAVVENWVQLYPLVIIYTVSFNVFIPARMVYIAEASLLENRASIYGLMNIAWPLGSLIAPVLAGVIADMYGWSPVFTVASTVMALCLAPALMIREVKGLSKCSEESEEDWSFRRLFKTMNLLIVFHVLISLTVGVSNTLLSIYVSEKFHASTTQVGFMFSMVGLATLMSQLGAAYILKKTDLKRFLQLCLLIMTSLYVFLPFVEDLNFFTIIYAVSYGLYSATWPASATLVTMAIPNSKWNMGMGFRQTAVRLGFSLASMMAGLLWSSLGSTSVFYVSSILAILTIVPLLLLKK
ncbi:MFS transporter [Candidatus Bathyarchaeota archaeon]|nr:MFS transporter [Candidatus Bathyarchaeota archaeon]MBS7613768.1 MFS transporter [Candidatus Bathyarchaeota archaeon]MBS7617524.1 MFS transporter [Candidatus Bathyarchaeota archaeon]